MGRIWDALGLEPARLADRHVRRRRKPSSPALRPDPDPAERFELGRRFAGAVRHVADKWPEIDLSLWPSAQAVATGAGGYPRAG